MLVTCGISTLLLASFYLIIDVWGYSKWAFFFIVFGVNSIAIYMMAHMFDFRLIGNIIRRGIKQSFFIKCARLYSSGRRYDDYVVDYVLDVS